MKIWDDLPPMDNLRSEKMSFLQLIIPVESYLGELGLIQFKDMRLGTVGAFLDPVADKLMVAATMVLLCTKPLEVAIFGEVPWILTIPSIAIIGREITMSAVREWAASQNAKVLEAVAVNNLGKWKTATQMTALTMLVAGRDPSLMGPES